MTQDISLFELPYEGTLGCILIYNDLYFVKFADNNLIFGKPSSIQSALDHLQLTFCNVNRVNLSVQTCQHNGEHRTL